MFSVIVLLIHVYFFEFGVMQDVYKYSLCKLLLEECVWQNYVNHIRILR